jgi:hypothetical protein
MTLLFVLAAPVQADEQKDKKSRGRNKEQQEQPAPQLQPNDSFSPIAYMPIVYASSANPALGGSPSNWVFVDESKPGAPVPNGATVQVGAQAPAGETAVHFSVGSTMEALTLQNLDAQLRGLRLADLTRLAYCTYLVDAPLPYAVSLQLNIDADLNDDNRAWQGRLVYEPARNGAVVQGEWQCWDTLAGSWVATNGAVSSFANAQNPQSLAAILERFPNLAFHPDYGGLVLRAGEGWSRFEGYVDGVLVGAAQATWLFDFEEPEESPVTQDQLIENQEQDEQNQERRNRERNHNNNDSDRNDDRDNDRDDDNDDDNNDWNDQRSNDFDRYQQVRQQLIDTCKDGAWEAGGYRNQGQCISHQIFQYLIDYRQSFARAND